MRNKFFLVACCCSVVGIYADNWIKDADQITEDWLVSTGRSSGYTDHINHFKRLFSKVDVKGLLEFGVGFSTKYFLDHCDHVVSVEFVTPGTGPDWLKYCVGLYHGCRNWTPIFYLSCAYFNEPWAQNVYLGHCDVYHAAAYQPVHYKSYAAINPYYLEELDSFILSQLAMREINVAFVDCGICIRGDLVSLLFDKVPVIAAHDIAPKKIRHLDDVYGYGRVIIPENYEEIYIPFGMGTAFWIKKEGQYRDLIEALKEYSSGVPPACFL